MLAGKSYLMIPGPTPVPPAVVAAMSRPMIGHRSADFADLYRRVADKLRRVCQTSNEVFVLTSSGTGAMETAVANVISRGDKVLALITGNFGERFARIARAYGASVVEVNFGWGGAVDPQVVADYLRDREIKAVLATQNETSTGVANDIAALGRLLADHPALLLVDAISGLGGMDIRTDEWGVDLLVGASQKALMLPPGLAFVTVSPKAWRVIERNEGPRFYFDLQAARKAQANWNAPFTPAVSLFFGLEAALDMILAEGLPRVFERHALLAAAVRAAVRALGLELLAPDEHASHTVTAVVGPEGVAVDELRRVLYSRYGVSVAGGQGVLRGKIFRIAHMGFVDRADVLAVLAALEMALAELNYPVALGSGVRAAQEVFLGRRQS